MNEPKPDKLHLTSLTPSLTVGDVNATLRFYTEVLGFEITERFEQDGRLGGAVLAAGEARLLIGQDDWKKGRDRQKGIGFRLYLGTAQSIDDLAAAIQARGAQLDREPTDQPWGTRDFAISDPDGFAITFSSEFES
jgi:uncharacterized glyoxalase superfamily protein PhnB